MWNMNLVDTLVESFVDQTGIDITPVQEENETNTSLEYSINIGVYIEDMCPTHRLAFYKHDFSYIGTLMNLETKTLVHRLELTV